MTAHSPKKGARPQKENGYTPIAHELIEAMAKTNFSPKQSRCLFFLARKTYGWGKKKTEIGSQEWIDGTGLHKSHVYTALRELISRNVVTRTGHQYGIQKDYTRWREVTRTRHSDQNPSPNGDQIPSFSGDKNWSPHPYNSLKDNNIKRQVTRTRYQEPPHPSRLWLTCPHCKNCQSNVKKGKPCPWCGKIV